MAVVTISTTIGKQSEYQDYAEQRRKEYTSNTYAPERNRCFSLASDLQYDCITKARSEYEAYNREQQDLVAQRTSALWTAVMGGTAIVGMWLSMVGVFLVWTTFNATKEGNAISQKIGETQIRAYMHPEAISIKLDIAERIISYRWRNKGQTPAIDCTTYVDMAIMPAGVADHTVESFLVLPPPEKEGMFCSVEAPIFFGDFRIDAATWAEIENRTKVLLLYSAIRWRDVFDVVCIAESCSEAIPVVDDPTKVNLRTYGFHNSFRVLQEA